MIFQDSLQHVFSCYFLYKDQISAFIFLKNWLSQFSAEEREDAALWQSPNQDFHRSLFCTYRLQSGEEAPPLKGQQGNLVQSSKGRRQTELWEDSQWLQPIDGMCKNPRGRFQSRSFSLWKVLWSKNENGRNQKWKWQESEMNELGIHLYSPVQQHLTVRSVCT